MSLKNRLGAFFLLAGAIFLFIFAASVFSPTGSYELLALFGGAALVVIGWRWRMAKGSGPPRSAAPPPAAPAPPPPKKQGPLGALLKGPASKKMQPKAAAPGGTPAGGGKPGGGKPGGKPGGGAPKGKR